MYIVYIILNKVTVYLAYNKLWLQCYYSYFRQNIFVISTPFFSRQFDLFLTGVTEQYVPPTDSRISIGPFAGLLHGETPGATTGCPPLVVSGVLWSWTVDGHG